MSEEKNRMRDLVKMFEKKDEIFTDNKKRIFTFSQLVTPGQTEIDGIKSLSSNENSTGDDYNLKNSFK